MQNIYREVKREIIIGKCLPALIINSNGLYVLDDIEVYKDGRIICESIEEDLFFEEMFREKGMSLERFARAVAQGKLVITVPQGVYVYRSGFASFMIAEINSELEKKEDYLLAVQDILRELNGEPTSLEHCQRAFLRFLEEPSKGNHEQLRLAYEMIPSPMKLFVLNDPDDADTPITAILIREVENIDKDWMEELRQRYTYLCE